MVSSSEVDTGSHRLDFIDLNIGDRHALRNNAKTILNIIPGILDNFYCHVVQFPETKRFFRNDVHIEHAKTAQLRHWSIILSGEFDEDYFRSVTAIGEVHNKLGLEPRWYIGAYSFLVTGLCAALGASSRFPGFGGLKRKEAQILRTAVIKAAMLDMDLALSVYIEAGKRDRRETIEKLGSEFADSVGMATDDLSGSANNLSDAAHLLTTATERTETETQTVRDS